MSSDNSSSDSPPTLRWKQGEIDGTIPLTKASGVRAALRDAGAIVSDDVIINSASWWSVRSRSAPRWRCTLR